MSLSGKRVAILVEQDYQDLEVWYPLLRLREEGAEVTVVGTGSSRHYTGKHGYPIDVDTDIKKISPDGFHAVVVPGGWAPDRLRQHKEILDFVAALDQKGCVVASICHGPWVLASARILEGRKVTAYKAIRDDLVHAGATFVDETVVRDRNLITSRVPSDLPAFCREIISALAEG